MRVDSTGRGDGRLPNVADADAETSVPDNETPAAQCPYCARPFRSEHLHALHVGEAHGEEYTEAEAAAYEAAYDDELDALFVYHLKVVAALVVLFFGFVYVYAFVWM